MQILRIGYWFRQLNGQGICRDLKLSHSECKVFYKSGRADADPKVVDMRKKLLYCDYLDYKNVRMGFKKRKQMRTKQLRYENAVMYKNLFTEPAFSVILDNRDKEYVEKKTSFQGEEENCTGIETKTRKPLYMPHSRVDSYNSSDLLSENVEEGTLPLLNEKHKDLYEKYLEAKERVTGNENRPEFKDYLESTSSDASPIGELWKVPSTWMSDFEQYDESSTNTDWHRRYGTPNPLSKISSISCSGCGALLHCKDPTIPGYLPSELLDLKNVEDLKLTTCQRCHFLKFYNAALKVKVSVEDYPKLLSAIKTKKCAILLIVDLTDFPCSIWPDLKSIIHPFTPVFLVGNKVDLLPKDSRNFFAHVEKQLLDTVVDVTGIKRENIKHVALTSTKTGYGIESLINKLHLKWRYKGDVYLVGCTNVGKSSMFNVLLKSDYCKVQAVDLVQCATTSPWPGTTLNLLKFPILNPTAKKLYRRMERLKMERSYKLSKSIYMKNKFRETGKMSYATLTEDVGRTFIERPPQNNPNDPFSEISYKSVERKFALDESRAEYKQSRWFYDTPGTIQRDQILDLLTSDELLATLPQAIISPRTFVLRPNETVFVAGMGRVDYVQGNLYIRYLVWMDIIDDISIRKCTLFTSEQLPITMCYTVDAKNVYERLLETEAFVVPTNDPERLKRWPKLESKEVKISGIDRNESAADIVLSSIGWIAITSHRDENVTLNAWTPEGRGIHVRYPALLRKSVALRGPKISGTPLYASGRKVFIK